MGRSQLSIEERFWAKVKKASGDGCWTWTAGKFTEGYGAFKAGGKLLHAHRVSWAFVHGSILPGLFVCHHCDNPPCVRPDHLFLGTNSDNQLDAVLKGRGSTGRPWAFPRGDKHWTRRDPVRAGINARRNGRATAKLSAADAEEIRRLRVAGLSLKEIGGRFGVAFQTVSKVVRGERWAR